MQEYLHDPVAVLVEVLLEVVHLYAALIVEFLVGLADYALGHMIKRLDILHLYGDDVLIVAAIENGYLTAAGDILVYAPQIIVSQLV